MKKQSILSCALLAVTSIFFAGPAWAQQDQRPVQSPPPMAELSVTYIAEHAQVAPGRCECFWLQGGGVNAEVTMWKGLGIAGAFSGHHTSAITPGVDVNEIEFIAGPSYQYQLRAWSRDPHTFRFFAQGLFGGTHGFNGVYPSSSGQKTSATASAALTGGGLDIGGFGRFGIRIFELDFARTRLPNSSTNVQNDLRVATGITYRFGRKG